MASMNSPDVNNPILEDIINIRTTLQSLARLDPSTLTELQNGTVRFVFDDANDKFTVQRFTGSSWQAIHNFAINADSVDGYSATTAAQNNTIAVRDASGSINANLNGNAATASTAAALSEPNPVAMGGTGGTTAAEARSNLSVTSTADFTALSNIVIDDFIEKGLGQDTVMLRDVVSDVFALQPHNGIYSIAGGDVIANTPPDANVGTVHISARIPNTSGTILFFDYDAPRIWLSITTSGAGGWIPWVEVTVQNASTTTAGKVQLSTSTSSTSTTTAATSSAVKSAMDVAQSGVARLNDAQAMGQLGEAVAMISGTSILSYTKTGNYAWISTSNITNTPNGTGSYGTMMISSDGTYGFRLVYDRSVEKLYMRLIHPTDLSEWIELTNQTPAIVYEAIQRGQVGGATQISDASLFDIVKSGTYSWSSTANVTDQPSGLTNSYGTMVVEADSAGYGMRLCFDRGTLNLYSCVVHPTQQPVWKNLSQQVPSELRSPIPDYDNGKSYNASEAITEAGAAFISGYSSSRVTVQIMQAGSTTWRTIGISVDSHYYSFYAPVGVGDKINQGCTVFPFRTY